MASNRAEILQERRIEMTVAQQLTKAVQTAQDNKLTKPHVSVRCPDDIPDEFAVKALPVNDTVALRSLEVWITNHNGYIYGVVGDHEDGRKNVIFAM
jgi:hypothetical protein